MPSAPRFSRAMAGVPIIRVVTGAALAAALVAATLTLPGAASTALAATASSPSDAPTTLSGTHVVIATEDAPGSDGSHQEHHFLEKPDGDRIELVGGEDVLEPDTAGEEVTATGTLTPAADGEPAVLAVSEIEADDPPTAESHAGGPIDIKPMTLGAKKTAVILIKQGESGAQRTNVAAQRELYFTGTASAAKHIAEMSWNQVTLVGRDDPVGGDVYDYLMIPSDTSCFAKDSAGAQAAQAAGIDLTSYDYVSFVLDSSAAEGCGYGGYATIGGKMSVVVDYGPGYDRRGTVLHELGHDFGLFHAHSVSCAGSDGSRVALRVADTGCSFTEYGDPFDVMGSSGALLPYSAVHKVRLGWIPETNVRTAGSSGDYEIRPNGIRTQGTHVLVIPRPDGESTLLVDFRQPTGTQGEAGVAGYPALMNGVTIRQGDRWGLEFSLVDSTPSTGDMADAPLRVGASLVDPTSGIRIETVSADSGHATVRVTYPDPGFNQVYLRGTHNGWALSTPMTKVAGTHSVWHATAAFGAGSDQRFKFDVSGDWTQSYGDSDRNGLVERGGGDIPTGGAAGTYSIQFEADTGRYWISRPPIVDAGPDIEIEVGKSVLLSASTTAQDRPVSSVKWECCTGVGVADHHVDLYGAKPFVSFPAAGVYDATVRAYDDRGDWMSDTVRITVIDDAPPVPVAPDEITVTVGQPAVLDGSASHDDHGPIASYTWACCRTVYGQWDVFKTSGAVVSYDFRRVGTYTPRLIVTDSRGQESFKDVIVHVVEGPENLPPVAGFTGSATIEAGKPGEFYGYDSYDPDGSIVSYSWSGAGQSATGPVWRPTFSDAGTYPVTLTVTDDDGATATKTTQVVVQAGSAGYASTYPQMLLRGTNNAWAANTPMTLVADHTWRVTATFGATSAERFKLDVSGDWATNFGDDGNDGIADQGGADIPVTAGAGAYTITFDEVSRRIQVVRQ